jgi:predicted short-subunit dehydrogenase-like oxidoreductase (DUF2520 family)
VDGRTPSQRIAVVGRGRVGRSLVAALADVDGPFGRGFDGHDHEVVILAVPDGAIAAAAQAVMPGRLVGHCAGALGLDVLAPHEAFGLHPLMTVTDAIASFDGAGAAIAGTTAHALAVARDLAARLGMHSFEIADPDRAAYHAAASMASNFLVTLEDAAEHLLSTVGAPRQVLAPLVRAALEHWIAVGGPDALTGPIARGDEHTVSLQRAAVVERAPELAALFDVLAERTRALAARPRGDRQATSSTSVQTASAANTAAPT